MKEPHVPVSRADIDSDFEALKTSVLSKLDGAHQLGEDRQRVEFFDVLRNLILEKETEGDEIAVKVLCWAYDRLAEEG